MSEGPMLVMSRLRTASVTLSGAALAFFATGMLVSLSRSGTLLGSMVLGAVALVLAIKTRQSTSARPGRVLAFVMAGLAIIAPAVIVVAVISAGTLAPTAAYTLTVDSPNPVNVIIKNGADRTSARWDSGDTITLNSTATVIGINAQTTTPTTVISCEIRRDGNIVVTNERAGAVDCSFLEGDD